MMIMVHLFLVCTIKLVFILYMISLFDLDGTYVVFNYFVVVFLGYLLVKCALCI